MRYALISDIHGNMPALQAVLEDAKNKQVDSYIFLGDYSMGLPYPNDVVNAIRNIEHTYIIRGNQEDYLNNLINSDQSTWEKGQLSTLYWNYKTLTDDNRDYLRMLPSEMKIEDYYTDIYAFHSVGEYFNDTNLTEITSGNYAISVKTNSYSPKDYIKMISKKISNDKSLKDILSKLPDGVYAYGHNHIQMHIELDNKIILNPGSCGIPLDFPNFAPYTILETSNSGYCVEELRVSYDLEKTVKEFRESDLYSQSKVFSEIIIKQLYSGREHFRFFFEYISDYANRINYNSRFYSIDVWEKAYEMWCEEQDYEYFKKVSDD